MQSMDEASSVPKVPMSTLPVRLLTAYSACCTVKAHVLAFALLALQAVPFYVFTTEFTTTICPTTLLHCTDGFCLHLVLTLWVNGHLGGANRHRTAKKEDEEEAPFAIRPLFEPQEALPTILEQEEGEEEEKAPLLEAQVPLFEAQARGLDVEAVGMEDVPSAGVAKGKGPTDEEFACDLGDTVSERSTAAGDGSDEESESSGDGDVFRSFAPEETAIIFDWDDTVLPHTWVRAQGLMAKGLRQGDKCELAEWQQVQLAELSAAAAETLRIARTLGTVVFVTNGEEGWIELSCRMFMPDLLPALGGVRVVSAQTAYKTRENSNRPVEWKARAFASELRRIFGAEALACPGTRKNVMSIGDSTCEREALRRATQGLPSTCAKSMKLVVRPEIGQLRAQHSILARALENLAQKVGDQDLCVGCTDSES